MYTYFISYKWMSDRQEGFGNKEISCNLPLNSIKEIQKISRAIEDKEKDHYGDSLKVVILNYILMNEKEE